MRRRTRRRRAGSGLVGAPLRLGRVGAAAFAAAAAAGRGRIGLALTCGSSAASSQPESFTGDGSDVHRGLSQGTNRAGGPALTVFSAARGALLGRKFTAPTTRAHTCARAHERKHRHRGAHVPRLARTGILAGARTPTHARTPTRARAHTHTPWHTHTHKRTHTRTQVQHTHTHTHTSSTHTYTHTHTHFLGGAPGRIDWMAARGSAVDSDRRHVPQISGTCRRYAARADSRDAERRVPHARPGRSRTCAPAGGDGGSGRVASGPGFDRIRVPLRWDSTQGLGSAWIVFWPPGDD